MKNEEAVPREGDVLTVFIYGYEFIIEHGGK
jgi:hypothetical protein